MGAEGLEPRQSRSGVRLSRRAGWLWINRPSTRPQRPAPLEESFPLPYDHARRGAEVATARATRTRNRTEGIQFSALHFSKSSHHLLVPRQSRSGVEAYVRARRKSNQVNQLINRPRNGYVEQIGLLLLSPGRASHRVRNRGILSPQEEDP